MLSALANRLDHRLAKVILARARRRWPLLMLIPAGWLGPLASATIVVIIVLVAVLP